MKTKYFSWLLVLPGNTANVTLNCLKKIQLLNAEIANNLTAAAAKVKVEQKQPNGSNVSAEGNCFLNLKYNLLG